MLEFNIITKSLISRNLVSSTLRKVSAAIQRYFTQLDPVANAHYELATPITLTGDFEIELDVLTTNATTGMMLFSGGTSTSGFELYKATNGSISIWQSGISKGGIGFNVADGKLHTIKLVRTGTDVEILIDNDSKSTVIGVSGDCIIKVLCRRDGGSFYFDGSLSDIAITDKSGAEDVTTTFALDKPTASALYEYGSELTDTDNPDLIESDWTNNNDGSFTLNDAEGSGGKLRLVPIANQAEYMMVAFTITNLVGSGLNVQSAGSNKVIVDGTYNVVVEKSNVQLFKRATGATSCTISNISVREITNYAEVQATKNIEYSKENTFGGDLWSGGDIDTQTQPSGYYSSFVDGVITSDGTSWGCYSNLDFPVVEGKTYLVKVRNETTNAQGKNKITSKSVGSTFLGTIEPPIHDGYSEALFTVPEGHTGQIYIRVYCQIGAVLGATVRMTEVSVREIQGNALTRINVDDEDIGLYTKTDDGWLGDKELVTNGGFDTDSNWNKGTGWSILNGTAQIDGTQTTYSAMFQDDVLIEGYTYKSSVDVIEIDGTFQTLIGSAGVAAETTVPKTLVGIGTAGGGTPKALQNRVRYAADTAKIDNVSAKHLIQIAEQS